MSTTAVNGAIQQTLKSMGHEYARNVYTMDEWMDSAVLKERLLAILSSFFATVALVLAFVGVHALLAYAIARRTREIGIRVPLGRRQLWLFG